VLALCSVAVRLAVVELVAAYFAAFVPVAHPAGLVDSVVGSVGLETAAVAVGLAVHLAAVHPFAVVKVEVVVRR